MPNVVFDASTFVGAAIKENSVPERALRLALARETLCLSQAVEDEVREVLSRPRFRRYFDEARRQLVLSRLVTGVSDARARHTRRRMPRREG
jgi:predicted nucleic acid-binding protein